MQVSEEGRQRWRAEAGDAIECRKDDACEWMEGEVLERGIYTDDALVGNCYRYKIKIVGDRDTSFTDWFDETNCRPHSAVEQLGRVSDDPREKPPPERVLDNYRRVKKQNWGQDPRPSPS